MQKGCLRIPWGSEASYFPWKGDLRIGAGPLTRCVKFLLIKMGLLVLLSAALSGVGLQEILPPCIKAVVLKICFMDQQHTPHLEIVKNVDSWAHPQTHIKKLSGVSLSTSVFKSPL